MVTVDDVCGQVEKFGKPRVQSTEQSEVRQRVCQNRKKLLHLVIFRYTENAQRTKTIEDQRGRTQFW